MGDDEVLGIVLVAIGAGMLIFIGLPVLIFAIFVGSFMGGIPGLGWMMKLAGAIPLVLGTMLIMAGIVLHSNSAKRTRN